MSGRMTVKNSIKSSVITLEVKHNVIAVSLSKSSVQLSKVFLLPKSTIKGILNKKEAVKKAIQEGSSAKRTRLKKAKHKELE